MSLRDSQKDMFEHSSKKVELLQKYLEAYLGVLSRDAFTSAIHCFDLFCGEGQYPNGGQGSPLVFTQALRKAAAIHKSKQFAFVFNDENTAKVTQVKELIAAMGPPPENLEIVSINKTFDDAMEWVVPRLKNLKREKALLFIDPYGYKSTPPSVISTLMQSGQTEVLLFLPTQQMFRFSKKGTPEALAQYLEVLNQGEPFPHSQGIADYLRFILNGFRAFMPDCIVDSFNIRKNANTWFCLFFFTKNLKGAEKMLDAKWKLDESNGQGWSYEHSLSTGLNFGAQINPLEIAILKSLNERGRTNTELYELTIRQGYRPTHAYQVLEALRKDGRIRVDPPSVPKGSYYLDYQSTHGADAKKHKIITVHLK